MDTYIDQLLRPDNPAAQSQQNPADLRSELTRLFATTFSKGGDLSSSDRDYASKIVSARTGLSQPDAEKRVTDVVKAAKANLDRARKAAMQLAIWLTLSLFIGAFSAAAAAWEGGGVRDGTWRRRV